MAEHWPPPEAFENWDIRVLSAKPVKDVFRVETSHGIYCLKPSVLTEARLWALDEAMGLLVRHGFLQVAPLIPTRGGMPFIEMGGARYYLTEWFEGRRPDALRIEEVRAVARCLGEFHLAARGLGHHPALRRELGRWPERLQDHRDELVGFVQEAQHAAVRTKFDRLFLEHASDIIEAADQALTRLAASDYPALCQVMEKEGCFCHGDIAYRNFIELEKALYIIDFDSLLIDLHLFDLGQLVRRTMKHVKWSVEVGREIILGYTAVNPLSPAERRVLAAYLSFPQKHWRLAHRYYRDHAGQPDKSTLEKLTQLIEFLPNFKRFNSEFSSWIISGGTV